MRYFAMPLSPEWDWVGWVALGLIVTATILAFMYQRKGHRKPSDLKGPIPIDGFAYCHYPKDLDDARGLLLLQELAEVRDKAWGICRREYEHDPEHKWIVSKLTLIHGEVEPAHPHVEWHPGAGRIVLRIQDSMFFHFANEVHNVFRYMMYGPLWMKDPKSDEDAENAVAVQNWIAIAFKAGG